MRQSFAISLAAFFICVLGLSAGAACAAEISVNVPAVGGVARLLVPAGYAHVPDTAPEYAFFRDNMNNLKATVVPLALFVNEDDLRAGVDGPDSTLPKYVIAGVPKAAQRTKLTKSMFAEFKKILRDSGKELMREGVDEAREQLDAKVDAQDLRVYDTPAEYALASMRMSVDNTVTELGCVTLFTLLDKRLTIFYFYGPLTTSESMGQILKEAEVYAQQNIDGRPAGFQADEPRAAFPSAPQQETSPFETLSDGAMKGAIAGALVGVAAWLFRRLKKKKGGGNKQSQAESSPAAHNNKP